MLARIFNQNHSHISVRLKKDLSLVRLTIASDKSKTSELLTCDSGLLTLFLKAFVHTTWSFFWIWPENVSRTKMLVAGWNGEHEALRAELLPSRLIHDNTATFGGARLSLDLIQDQFSSLIGDIAIGQLHCGHQLATPLTQLPNVVDVRGKIAGGWIWNVDHFHG